MTTQLVCPKLGVKSHGTIVRNLEPDARPARGCALVTRAACRGATACSWQGRLTAAGACKASIGHRTGRTPGPPLRQGLSQPAQGKIRKGVVDMQWNVQWKLISWLAALLLALTMAASAFAGHAPPLPGL